MNNGHSDPLAAKKTTQQQSGDGSDLSAFGPSGIAQSGTANLSLNAESPSRF
jgi:hypothetical protein